MTPALNIRVPLRVQVFGALASTGLLLLVTLGVLLPKFVVTRFDEQELARMDTDTLRVAAALNTELDSLNTFVLNWSNWDDTYHYVQHPNRAYETSNLVPDSFKAARLNLMLFLDSYQQLVHVSAYDLTDQKLVPGDALAHEVLRRYRRELLPNSPQSSRQGIVMLSSGPWLLAARPILTGSGHGPAAGTLIMGRQLTPTLLRDLKRDPALSLTVTRAPKGLSARMIHSPGDVLTEAVSDTQVLGRTLVHDLAGAPTFLLSVRAERQEHANGLLTARMILLSVLLVVLTFTGLCMLLINTLLLKRLGRYRQQVQVIRTEQQLSTRFLVSGHDELSDLGHALNGLLDQNEVSQRQLHQQATYDDLTGLPNRTEFQRVLADMIRSNHPLAVMLLDLDNFKSINDTLGHDFGDEVLRGTAARLATAVPEGGLLARLGGDEFAVLLPTGNAEPTAMAQAERVISVLSQPIHTRAIDLQIRASAGVSHWPDDACDRVTLLKHADLAMYWAKTAQSGLEQYHSAFSEQAMYRGDLERSLQSILAQQELWVAYQPIIDLATGQPVGCEALLRWEHPEYGSVSPETFIPIAEERGLIQEIGLWVLRTACRDAAAWNSAGRALKVAVNVSAVQLRGAHFAEHVTVILNETGLPPALLELEVTETAVMVNMVETTRQLFQLRSIGVSVALDDFGTGYASLELVRDLPLNQLKLDRAFMTAADTDPRSRLIMSTVIDLADALDLEVVAEGVETSEQHEMLLAWDCPFAQGYYYSRPLSQDAFMDFLKREHRSFVDDHSNGTERS
ncbi:bifunctional diguanylate cyclase/phosphodiesterase (plasmid) [Deinococcus sp. KNUC1210]|uniref:putative bifunctional diguanylate cyclase/phosphodiesterase n=1 Tax=Deinococcus sp. KNUC1210 TaxID=2917691 RepID=UPI001EF00E14|nr:bifunctional diguanylate cyclase/phosphodiesterase [Deinococcus sp. KNUC1210]ULH17992.1 bifunctional diguanylate cyclase/phosphodiesterase [Deinococcus sp. KNUC1210]